MFGCDLSCIIKKTLNKVEEKFVYERKTDVYLQPLSEGAMFIVKLDWSWVYGGFGEYRLLKRSKKNKFKKTSFFTC